MYIKMFALSGYQIRVCIYRHFLAHLIENGHIHLTNYNWLKIAFWWLGYFFPMQSCPNKLCTFHEWFDVLHLNSVFQIRLKIIEHHQMQLSATILVTKDNLELYGINCEFECELNAELLYQPLYVAVNHPNIWYVPDVLF